MNSLFGLHNNELEHDFELDDSFAFQSEFESPISAALTGPTSHSIVPRLLTYSTRDVLDNRISVPAQHSLVRLSKNKVTSKAAVGLLEAVKAGRLVGIKCVNWDPVAKRAKRLGKTWWTVIPKGEDAVLLLDPDNLTDGAPLIAFRRELDKRNKYGCGSLPNDTYSLPSPARLDSALIVAWQVYVRFRKGEIAPCTLSPDSAITPSGEATVPETCLFPPLKTMVVPCRSFREPTRAYETVQSERRSKLTVAVQPNLSFYQECTTYPKNQIQGFKNLAARQARRNHAIATPSSWSSSPPKVGETGYKTGSDIIHALEWASKILGKKVQLVHIFGHSGQHGLVDCTRNPNMYHGLYVYQTNTASWFQPGQPNYAGGGRHVVQIPTYALADDIVFVLHGCNTAMRRDTRHSWGQGSSFAESLFHVLYSAGRRDAKVFGHGGPHRVAGSPGIGRNRNWIEFSKTSPGGRFLPVLSPIYYRE